MAAHNAQGKSGRITVQETADTAKSGDPHHPWHHGVGLSLPESGPAGPPGSTTGEGPREQPAEPVGFPSSAAARKYASVLESAHQDLRELLQEGRVTVHVADRLLTARESTQASASSRAYTDPWLAAAVEAALGGAGPGDRPFIRSGVREVVLHPLHDWIDEQPDTHAEQLEILVALELIEATMSRLKGLVDAAARRGLDVSAQRHVLSVLSRMTAAFQPMLASAPCECEGASLREHCSASQSQIHAETR